MGSQEAQGWWTKVGTLIHWHFAEWLRRSLIGATLCKVHGLVPLGARSPFARPGCVYCITGVEPRV